jgi:hypothetical protein
MLQISEGTHIWRGTGAIDPSIDINGRNLGNLMRPRTCGPS